MSFQYHAEDGTWNVEYIHGLGMYALKDGYLIRLSDAEGQVIWDAENHDMTLCHQIMQDIRTQIAERGYTKNELKFADVAAKTGEMSDEIADYFELDHFGLTVERMNSTRKVQCWRLIGGNRLAVFFKKIIRKLIKFYVEPIIDEQNQFNFYTTSAMTQLYAKMQDEQAVKIMELQQQVETLELKCKRLEEKCGE